LLIRHRITGNRSRSEAIIELQQHLFYYASSGLWPRHFQWTVIIEARLRLSQPSRGFCVIAEDLLSLGNDADHPDCAVRFFVAQGLIAGFPVSQGPTRHDEGINLLIAHSMIWKRFQGTKFEAASDQALQIAIRAHWNYAEFSLNATIEHGWFSLRTHLSSLGHW
jgi:hypothetical protein